MSAHLRETFCSWQTTQENDSNQSDNDNNPSHNNTFGKGKRQYTWHYVVCNFEAGYGCSPLIGHWCTEYVRHCPFRLIYFWSRECTCVVLHVELKKRNCKWRDLIFLVKTNLTVRVNVTDIGNPYFTYCVLIVLLLRHWTSEIKLPWISSPALPTFQPQTHSYKPEAISTWPKLISHSSSAHWKAH